MSEFEITMQGLKAMRRSESKPPGGCSQSSAERTHFALHKLDPTILINNREKVNDKSDVESEEEMLGKKMNTSRSNRLRRTRIKMVSMMKVMRILASKGP